MKEDVLLLFHPQPSSWYLCSNKVCHAGHLRQAFCCVCIHVEGPSDPVSSFAQAHRDYKRHLQIHLGFIFISGSMQRHLNTSEDPSELTMFCVFQSLTRPWLVEIFWYHSSDMVVDLGIQKHLACGFNPEKRSNWIIYPSVAKTIAC